MIRKLTQLLFILSFTLLFLSSPVLAANISGHVKFGDIPVCSMVLANGQYMFTCSGDGSFNLDVPLDGNGEITVYAFCSGMAPYKQIITPEQGANMQIAMTEGVAGAGMDMSYSVKAMNSTWVLVEGTLTYDSQPICAMALANGQYEFTCSGDGSFSLLVPLDDMGSVTQYGFCEGLPPHQQIITTAEIDFTNDYDNDGYTVAEGDTNDFNSAINPGVVGINPADLIGTWNLNLNDTDWGDENNELPAYSGSYLELTASSFHYVLIRNGSVYENNSGSYTLAGNVITLEGVETATLMLSEDGTVLTAVFSERDVEVWNKR